MQREIEAISWLRMNPLLGQEEWGDQVAMILLALDFRLSALEESMAGSRTTARPTTASPSAAVEESTDPTTPLLQRLLGVLTDRELTHVASVFSFADRLRAFEWLFSTPAQDVSGTEVQEAARSILAKRAAQSSAAPQEAAPVESVSGGNLNPPPRYDDVYHDAMSKIDSSPDAGEGGRCPGPDPLDSRNGLCAHGRLEPHDLPKAVTP